MSNTKEEKYAKILNYYYRNYNKCPVCHEDMTEQDKDKIDIKCLECGYIINLDLAEYVNLFQKLFETEETKAEILTDINNLIELTDNSETRKKKLAELKKRYLEINEENEKFQQIIKVQKEKLDELKTEKFNIFNDLIEIQFQRKFIFNKIGEPLSFENREKIIEIYKNEGLIKDKRVKEVSKNTKLTPENIKNWIEWFDLVLKYGQKNKLLFDTIKKIIDLELEYQKNNENYKIKDFKIKDFKEGLPPKKNKKVKIKIKKTKLPKKKDKKDDEIKDDETKDDETKDDDGTKDDVIDTEDVIEEVEEIENKLDEMIENDVIKEEAEEEEIKEIEKKEREIEKKEEGIKEEIKKVVEQPVQEIKPKSILKKGNKGSPLEGLPLASKSKKTKKIKLIKKKEDKSDPKISRKIKVLKGGRKFLGDLTGKTISIDPYNKSLTWASLEGINNINVEKY